MQIRTIFEKIRLQGAPVFGTLIFELRLFYFVAVKGNYIFSGSLDLCLQNINMDSRNVFHTKLVLGTLGKYDSPNCPCKVTVIISKVIRIHKVNKAQIRIPLRNLQNIIATYTASFTLNVVQTLKFGLTPADEETCYEVYKSFKN